MSLRLLGALAPLLLAPGAISAQASAGADPAAQLAQAAAIVATARPGDQAAAERARALVVAATGYSQPELLDDLASEPPRFTRAAVRLRALGAALDRAQRLPDATSSEPRLREIMAESRYAALRQPPSLWDRFTEWLEQRLAELLGWLLLGRGRGLDLFRLVVAGLSLVGLGALALLLTLALRSRLQGSAAAAGAMAWRERLARDHFAQADRLAAAGDLLGSVRELALGVALRLGGETWEESPDTVREVFARSPSSGALKPLLQTFEAGVYGHRSPGAEEYAQAAAAARPWRDQPAAGRQNERAGATR